MVEAPVIEPETDAIPDMAKPVEPVPNPVAVNEGVPLLKH